MHDEVGGLVVFQFYHANHLTVELDGPVGFLGVRLVLLLGDEVIVGRGVQRVAQYLHEQFAEESLLKLFLFRLEDVLLDVLVQEILLERLPWLVGDFFG